MSQDITHAFDHPVARARATTGAAMPDRISLRDHTVEVEIGAFQAERGTTQRICFNVVVEVAARDVTETDDVDTILSYDRVTEAIAAELAAERLNLLETLAERVAERILIEPQALRVFVRIEKLDRGPGALGVEIVRAAAQVTPVAVEPDPVAPHVVFLGNTGFGSGVVDWLDTVDPEVTPLVLCVGAPEAPPPTTDHKMVQRRINLLAIEQNAWMLAAHDDRCVVVGTRTELDWAMKNGQICVWAPSKMVLDAVDGPVSHAPEVLALWLAETLGDARVSFVATDGALPAEAQPAGKPAYVSRLADLG
ncbi:dihydroneopterin aldolase [Pseudaestuariivita sp.]|uniref:dihydroneopterin aldolase n=1 Tax=Pseudaestuariivita sp. TaxID=2211669 RepID=UPI0040584C1F